MRLRVALGISAKYKTGDAIRRPFYEHNFTQLNEIMLYTYKYRNNHRCLVGLLHEEAGEVVGDFFFDVL